MTQPNTPQRGQSFQVPGTIVTFLGLGTDTNGAFSLFDCRVAPHQGAQRSVPLHQHADDEAFLVLEGTFDFQVLEDHLHLGPGAFTFIPKMTLHRYTNESSDQEGRLLIITLPAGNHERFFAEAGEPIADPAGPFLTAPPDMAKLMTIGARNGIEIVPPAISTGMHAS